MSESVPLSARLAQVSAAYREQVLSELEIILSSYHFRGSKRYPALLRYIVYAALDGRSSDLKERTLGVEVFGRHPNYDTSADPVVRISAGEVRKRIAQHYHESDQSSPLRIELPLGSYIPEFQWLAPEPLGEKSHFEVIESSGTSVTPRADRRGWYLGFLFLAVLILLLGVYAIDAHLRASSSHLSIEGQIWAPFTNYSAPALIVVGPSRPASLPPASPNTSFYDDSKVPYHHVTVATSVAMTHVASALRVQGKPFAIKESTETSLTDIRKHPLVLVGATNNEWTMRLVANLRYRFLDGPVVQIQDAQNPQNPDWTIDVTKPYSAVTTDYAIVARFYDPTTEAPVLVLAGLGPYGTQAASEFVDSPAYLAQIAKKAPAGWEKQNFEMIVETQIISSQAGPPELLTVTVW